MRLNMQWDLYYIHVYYKTYTIWHLYYNIILYLLINIIYTYTVNIRLLYYMRCIVYICHILWDVYYKAYTTCILLWDLLYETYTIYIVYTIRLIA